MHHRSDRNLVCEVSSPMGTYIVCTTIQVNSPNGYETCPANGRRTMDDGRRTTDDGRRTTDDGQHVIA
jgi:hypothetical protein